MSFTRRVGSSLLILLLLLCACARVDGKSKKNNGKVSFDEAILTSDSECVALFDSDAVTDVKPSHISTLMNRAYWECAKACVKHLGAEDDPSSLLALHNEFDMQQRSITRELNALKSVLESSKPVQSISPAFEWAQSGDEIFINLKFAHKLDAPATLDVQVDSVDMTAGGVQMSASKDRKVFALDLAFYADVVPDESSWALASVGRATLTFKKAAGKSVWPRLLKEGGKKKGNMHTWWTKQEQFSEELEDIEEEQREKAAKIRKEKEKEAAGEGEEEGSKTDGSEGEESEGKATEKEPSAVDPVIAALAAKRKELTKEEKAQISKVEKEYKEKMKAVEKEAADKKKELNAEKEEEVEKIKETFKTKLEEEKAKIKEELSTAPKGKEEL